MIDHLARFDLPPWLNQPLSGNWLLITGGLLLFLAGLLLGLRRNTRLSLQSSPLTQELMAYLARIADAVERPHGPNADEITAEVLRRLEQMANSKGSSNVRQIPNSVFGREYRRDE